MADEERVVGEAEFEGYFTRLLCSRCENVFDVEGDVANGEIVECDNCCGNLEVTGR